MTIPWDWLLCETTPAEVEADLAAEGAPDLWLRGWRALSDRMAPGDELWRYWKTEYAATVEVSRDQIAGCEQILDAETLDHIGLLEEAERSVRTHDGYAVVRDDEIIDWIESPF